MTPNKDPDITKKKLIESVKGLSKKDLIYLYMKGCFHINPETIEDMIIYTINLVPKDRMNDYAEAFPRMSTGDKE